MDMVLSSGSIIEILRAGALYLESCGILIPEPRLISSWLLSEIRQG
jgi:hypothetical protein